MGLGNSVCPAGLSVLYGGGAPFRGGGSGQRRHTESEGLELWKARAG